MSLDVSLLSIMKHRRTFFQLHRTVNDRAIDSKTKIILDDYRKYFDSLPDCETIPLAGDFLTWFTTVAHRALKPEDIVVYKAMFTQAVTDVPQDSRDLIVGKLLEADLAVAAMDVAEAWHRGDDVDISRVLQDLTDNYEAEVKRKVRVPVVEMDQNLFDEDKDDSGLHWAWDCLNETMRPLRGGDFIILAGRPDKGKTSAVAHNITHMAHQIDDLYPDEGRSVIWLNNEGPGKRILKRVIQCALGIPMSEVVKKQVGGTLWDEYAEAIGGDLHKIKVIDIHGYKSWQVEEILKQIPPGLLIFDMIDNVRFDGEVLNGGTRTDQLLEGMYQWGRELAVKHNCPVIATSQISADGDGMTFPTLPMLKDSKTGKQGTADAIITIGARNEEAFRNIRFVGTTKNKLAREGRPQSPRAELIFDGPVGRFIQAEGGSL